MPYRKSLEIAYYTVHCTANTHYTTIQGTSWGTMYFLNIVQQIRVCYGVPSAEASALHWWRWGAELLGALAPPAGLPLHCLASLGGVAACGASPHLGEWSFPAGEGTHLLTLHCSRVISNASNKRIVHLNTFFIFFISSFILVSFTNPFAYV